MLNSRANIHVIKTMLGHAKLETTMIYLHLQKHTQLPALGRLGGGVAFWAHIGGFAAGVVLAGPLTRADYLQQHLRQPPRRGARYRF